MLKRLLFALCAILCALPGIAREITVGGIVSDSESEPLIGVSVAVKGTTKAVVTDINGHYTIACEAGNTLVFSYVGCQPQEIKVSNDTNALNVTLSENAAALNEVVVVGYGVQKKSVMSSAVSRVSADDLDRGNPTNIQNALKGKVSGVQIISNSGQPGSDSKIRIRGIGTTNDSDPLYIVDGMPSEEGINHLNPSDIESIEILKDAASAAIYGSRGANGVVLVTTKKGQKGRATVNYEFTYGIQNPSKKVEFLNAAEYKTIMTEMAAVNNIDPYPISGNYDTDWQEALRNKNAPIMNHKVSISGGNDNQTYYLSFGYVNQEGIFAKGHSNYERYNARVNYNNVFYENQNRSWLSKITFGSNITYSKSKKTGTSIGNSEGGGLIASMNMLPPTEPIYQTDPDVLASYDTFFPNRVIAPNGLDYNIIDMREICNPLAAMQVSHNQETTPQNFGANLSLDFDVWRNIKFRTTYNNDWVFNEIKGVTPVYQLNTTQKNETSSVYDAKRTSHHWQWENILSWNETFGLHNVGALVGTSMSSYHYSNLEANDYDLLVVSMDKAYVDTATAAEELSKVWGGARDHRMGSFFARANYNYDERYLAEFVVRRDGSSNFSRKHQYATFPSVSAGWVFTREKFWNVPDWFTFGKLRASWGRNGNERIGSFAYTTMMQQGHNAVIAGQVVTGMLPKGYANADLQWETSEQWDLGLDLRFFNSALTFSVDWFSKKTKDMLLWKPIPLYTSYSGMTVNGGTVDNHGVEFELSYKVKAGEVNLGFSGNASWIKNKVTDNGPDMTGLDQLGGGMGGTITWIQNGRPYGFFYGYKTDGIFQNQAEIDNYKSADGTLIQPNAKPGDLRFVDIDGEGGLTANDRTLIGNPNPDWVYGFTINADWRDFDFSAFFQGSIGNDIYKLYRRSNATYGNWEKKWLNRWHGEGTSNTVPQLGNIENNYQISDFFVEDGSYLRLKVLQIGYSMPRTLLSKVGIKGLRFFLQGENLFTVTSYTGYDPEVGTRNGLDGGTYPQARTYTIGAHLTF